MASNSPIECGVCQEEFNKDEYQPRMLLCSHQLCTVCISQLIANNTRKCPFCRANIEANSAEDLMINHGLLDVMEYMTLQSSTPTSQAKRINDFKQETTEKGKCLIETCKTMQELIENLIKEMEENIDNIHQQNETIKNEVIFKFNEMILSNKEYIQDLKDKRNSLLEPLVEINLKKNQLEILIEKLDKVNSFKEAGSAVESSEETNTYVSEWTVKLKEFLCQEETTLRMTAKDIKASTEIVGSTLVMLSSREKISREFEQNPASFLRTFQEIHNRQISLMTLQEMREPIKRLIKQGRIFAVQNQNGRTRSARITFSDNKLYVHHLIDGPPPQLAHVVEHSDILMSVDPSSRLVFLELEVGESILGKILIRLSPDTDGARNFALLCSGEMGPSYAHTNMIDFWFINSNIASVRGGDYEFNNGNGGKPLIPGLQKKLQFSKEYRRPMLAGTVWGYVSSAFVQYCIVIEDECYGYCSQAFGRVEEGLKILKVAITQYETISKVTVESCGIVLPCSSS